MGICISLLSGKGGSGKTTLGLGMAKMLSSCGIFVLLIDCDMSTHGATYFFEHMLTSKDALSFLLLNNDTLHEKNDIECIHVDMNFDFIPSISSLSEIKREYRLTENTYIAENIKLLKEKYQVIICDCQAGYTTILEDLLPHMDENLVVVEADAISSSSVRVLYSQISSFVNDKKTYQIFNKITNEERQTYEKITFGTMFTNLSPILFNWEVRRAFALSQVPELKTTNSEFGNGIHALCLALFPMLHDDLDKYRIELLKRKRNELKKKLQSKKTSNPKELLPTFLSIFAVISSMVSWFLLNNEDSGKQTIVILSVSIIMVAIFIFFMIGVNKFPDRKQRKGIADELYKVNSALSNLTSNNTKDDEWVKEIE